jgi:hypothetical protein
MWSILRGGTARWVWLVAVLLLAGCGGSSDEGKTVKKQLTIPGYANVPAVTVPITKGSPARCRLDAKGITHNAVRFLAPSPTSLNDVYFLGARNTFVDFKAHRCDLAYLRGPLSRRLTAKQRRRLVARFTFLGETGRKLSSKAPRK